MKHIRNIALVFFMIVAVAVISSCSKDDGSGYIFKMNIENNPKNLDAQMAVDRESIMIITNMMEGLMKVDSSGAIIPAAAESFEMSEDGLVYTFYLKQNQMWDTAADFSAEMTADDFVFAFHRIFDKETESPYANDYGCIKNAAAVLNGIADVSELGVRAVDKYTVEFTLEYPYFNFLSLLTRSSAMPCNREFFEFTMGKYGMAAEATASNGAFYLREWNYDPYWDNNYIIMRRNASYSEKKYVYPYSLNFFITGDSSLDSVSYSEGDTDCYISSKKITDNSNCASYQTKTVGLLFNVHSEYVDNYEIREALAKAINREAYSHQLSDNISTAYGIIPGEITLQGRRYRDLSPDKLLSVYDVDASALWSNALKKSGRESVDGIKITVSDSFAENEIIYNISDQWREQLLLQSNVEIVSQTEYDSKINEGAFTVALVEIGADENSVYDFFEYFTAEEYYSATVKPGLVSMIKKSERAESLSDAVEQYTEIEKEILDEYVFVPLFYKNEYFISASDSADMNYYPFMSAVDFNDAKYY